MMLLVLNWRTSRMFDIKTVQNFSRISSRGVFGQALTDIEPQMDDLMVLTADVTGSARLVDFKKQAPNKIINVGIAEQNMVGIAAGLASVGKTVFATTFAPFASMRCYEMLRTQLGYMNLNVKVVGLMSGLAGGVVGNTHFGLEDLAITRTIPNMTVLSPADGVETYKAVCAAAEINGPCYIRLTGTNGFAPVYKEDFDFKIGKGVVLKNGTDVALIATGSMVNEAVRTARVLARENISATVVDMHTIKPLDTALLNTLFSNHKMIVTMEEHFCIGGLGSAVAEYKTTFDNAPVQMIIGIPDKFPKAGDYAYLLNECQLTASQIASKIIQRFQETN